MWAVGREQRDGEAEEVGVRATAGLGEGEQPPGPRGGHEDLVRAVRLVDGRKVAHCIGLGPGGRLGPPRIGQPVRQAVRRHRPGQQRPVVRHPHRLPGRHLCLCLGVRTVGEALVEAPAGYQRPLERKALVAVEGPPGRDGGLDDDGGRVDPLDRSATLSSQASPRSTKASTRTADAFAPILVKMLTANVAYTLMPFRSRRRPLSGTAQARRQAAPRQRRRAQRPPADRARRRSRAGQPVRGRR